MCPFSETNAASMRTLRTLQAGQSGHQHSRPTPALNVRLEFHSLATIISYDHPSQKIIVDG
jgi:hypothetical protein